MEQYYSYTVQNSQESLIIELNYYPTLQYHCKFLLYNQQPQVIYSQYYIQLVVSIDKYLILGSKQNILYNQIYKDPIDKFKLILDYNEQFQFKSYDIRSIQFDDFCKQPSDKTIQLNTLYYEDIYLSIHQLQQLHFTNLPQEKYSRILLTKIDTNTILKQNIHVNYMSHIPGSIHKFIIKTVLFSNKNFKLTQTMQQMNLYLENEIWKLTQACTNQNHVICINPLVLDFTIQVNQKDAIIRGKMTIIQKNTQNHTIIIKLKNFIFLICLNYSRILFADNKLNSYSKTKFVNDGNISAFWILKIQGTFFDFIFCNSKYFCSNLSLQQCQKT
ncbi:unnamed protein product [Paramecium octaurelia]|uniref:Uncharacterized protein n=1 Tax=Paramecium octaurelia TaxID=43137 RepID=A0A8S1XGH5_PAROT|nr:unnamed protein product [Paramecium octaurelia]